MFIFILFNLLLAFLLKIESAYYSLFSSDFSLYIGVGLMLVTLIDTANKFKIIPFRLRYDLFAVGALLVWLWYWPEFFRKGSPIFYYFPLFFSLITAFCSLMFITKREHIDADMVIFLQWLSDSGRFNPVVIMVGVMIGLAVPQHFLLFPIFIILLVTRFALACSLENE